MTLKARAWPAKLGSPRRGVHHEPAQLRCDSEIESVSPSSHLTQSIREVDRPVHGAGVSIARLNRGGPLKLERESREGERPLPAGTLSLSLSLSLSRCLSRRVGRWGDRVGKNVARGRGNRVT